MQWGRKGVWGRWQSRISFYSCLCFVCLTSSLPFISAVCRYPVLKMDCCLSPPTSLHLPGLACSLLAHGGMNYDVTHSAVLLVRRSDWDKWLLSPWRRKWASHGSFCESLAEVWGPQLRSSGKAVLHGILQHKQKECNLETNCLERSSSICHSPRPHKGRQHHPLCNFKSTKQ